MKKTLTVNLGGTVFNIDDDAYRLLDNYLSNLKMHFRKEAGADEIVDDIERRISELFAEKLSAGSQVITIADVEEVIARMGKPEDMEAEGESASADSGSTSAGGGYGAGAWNSNTAYGTTRRRLYRNPDDKMLGGVISGMAAYLGWDVTLLRLLLLVILICGVGTLIPVYIVCWLVIPEARTAAEKLSMRGEAVTVENIGKTVTDGFEKVANGVNDYMRSDKPRTFLQKLGDALVMIVGWFLKICLVIFAIICSPVLFVFGVVFVALLFAAIAVAVGGGAALISFFPMADVYCYFSVVCHCDVHCRNLAGRNSFGQSCMGHLQSDIQMAADEFRFEVDAGYSLDCKCGLLRNLFCSARGYFPGIGYL